MRQTLGHTKSIAGAALAGLGIFIFYENLYRAATQLCHHLDTVHGGGLGLLPTVILAVSRVLQAADHRRFLHDLLQRMLVSCWPLLLVMLGAVLSRDASTDNVNALAKKD